MRFAKAWLVLALAASPALAGAINPASPVDWSKAETVTVNMVEYSFDPDHLIFHSGVAYHLHLENRGRELHEFTAASFFKSVQVRNPEVLAREGQEVVLQPGERKDVYFVAGKPGHYALSCADHDWQGMTGDILVQ